MSNLTDPSFTRQMIFFTTGAVAGSASAAADYGFDRISSLARGSSARPVNALVASMLPHMLRPGIRFWGFDIAKSSVLPDQLPVGLKGGLAGAFGGFLEMSSTNAYSAITSTGRSVWMPAIRTTLLHSCKLFLCFGSYTQLANTYSSEQPPRPFAYCLLLGAIAGAFGTMTMTPLELYTATPLQLRARQVFSTALSRAPRGAVGIGTVIAVQVTSSAWLLGKI